MTRAQSGSDSEINHVDAAFPECKARGALALPTLRGRCDGDFCGRLEIAEDVLAVLVGEQFPLTSRRGATRLRRRSVDRSPDRGDFCPRNSDAADAVDHHS